MTHQSVPNRWPIFNYMVPDKTDLWTLPRVAALIEDLTGVEYHPGHVWRLLGASGCSCQRPERRAVERNEKAIRRWKRVEWPALKQVP